MKHLLSPLTKDLIEALAASAGLWLGRLLAVLLAPRAANHRRRLARVVRLGESWVEEFLVVMAGRRLGPVRRRITMWLFARPGFRIARGHCRLLCKSAGVRLRDASLIARVQRLIAVLVDPEPCLARICKRLVRGLCFRRLVASAPGAVAFTSADAQAVAFSDSS